MVADMLSSPRSAYALAEAGQLPRSIAYIHPTRHTPVVAIALYATAVVLVAATGSFRQIAVLAVAGTLAMYLIVCLGVLRLRAKGVAQAGAPFVAPGGSLVPLAAVAMTVWLLSTLAWRELAAGGLFIAVSAAIFLLRGRKAGP
jgi:amino acid transporter